MKYITTLLFITSSLFAQDLQIISKPIIFDSHRIELTKKYIHNHYNKVVNNITITPKIIVVHHTAVDDFNASFNRFLKPSLPKDRVDISKASALNVSAHFLVDRDGTIYQLMPENFMARHVIGLNYSSIGIENVGGNKLNLTQKQLIANAKLIKYLKNRYSSIEYVIAHSEYQAFENSTLWLEQDSGYRTLKHDPSQRFMSDLRVLINDK